MQDIIAGMLNRILKTEIARKQAAAAITERNKTSRIKLAPPKTYSQYREKMYGKGTKDSDLSSKQKNELAKDYIENLEEIAYIDSSKRGQPNRFYRGFEQSVLPQGYFQGNKRRYRRGGLVIPEREANPTFQGKLQPFSHPMERRPRVSKFSINTDSDEKTRHPLDKKLYRHAFTAQIKMEEAHEKAKNAIEERNKTTRVQLAPPKTFDQFRESMYGEGVRTKDLSSGQQKRLRGDYIKAMEEIAYVDSGKQSNRFYREYDQSVLPQGYFQGNKRRYKTGGLVIAQEETNSNKPRGARKELKGTKFKGVF